MKNTCITAKAPWWRSGMVWTPTGAIASIMAIVFAVIIHYSSASLAAQPSNAGPPGLLRTSTTLNIGVEGGQARLLLPPDPNEASAEYISAKNYYAQRDYVQARKYFQLACDKQQKPQRTEGKETADCLMRLAAMDSELAHYGEAIDGMNRAEAIYAKLPGNEIDQATVYNNRGVVFHAQGDYAKALEFYGKALAIREKVLGKEHPDNAAAYDNMALVHNAQGDYAKALEFYGKALAIREKVLGKEHLDTATTYLNIAGVYADQCDHVKALEFDGKALTICEKALGKEHPLTAATYDIMALVYNAQGDYAKALEFYGKVLAIREKVLGKEHPDTATTYNNIASVYEDQGDYVKAMGEFLKAYHILLAKFGEEHPNTQTIKSNMQRVHKKTGNSQPFDEWLRQALAAPDHPGATRHPNGNE